MPKPKPRRKAPKTTSGPVVISEQDILILQTLPTAPVSTLEDHVFALFDAAREGREPNEEWLGFSTVEATHWSGKTTWVGFTENVPLEVVDTLQKALEEAGLAVEREMGRALYLEMSPFARLADDGLEVLVPAALARDTSKPRQVRRGRVELGVRAYTLKRQASVYSPEPSQSRSRDPYPS